MNTYEHSLRVGRLARHMASEIKLSEIQTRLLIYGCYLHDIGKIFIPNEILNKNSSLTRDEWNIMKSHSLLGAEWMEKRGDIDKEIIEIIKFHHERWNGEGYPYGLGGNNIPDFAKVCAIIDSFDCMVSDRPYRRGLSLREAKSELLLHSNGQFDKHYVDLFIRLSDEVLDPFSTTFSSYN
ncbi:HD-GYP domain-containing protein [Paenibacillus silviterrae]|uniref:HD-GYP domain-containing protein n=1 Tax=Paenibacillus silviterrae TaxID=3242194 RepID=UPI0025431D22|nr:HD domain-containing phosphohydrolase [Paenibacillus chinjuensis]